ncbi:hypothetical protein MUK70_12005 [Dyadobacter chenwenxiniae]|uniref:Uncharacterized protein n=1 Tax=Dyadobacter chenwenxiniae TaxID=2906456 RepID=A0A9X1TBM0_9BACT|nr:hypothetical protein [Dyadobacter chenwenxiniae]MCF0059966.1 hypothetical protein [Dyadobacter chenwenxiniae]UON85705.1 hypothetical protein MUK70_12005 [Dyadobacter chenwenxiniae]
MDYLPYELGRSEVFRESAWEDTIRFPDGFAFPALEDLRAEIRYGRVVKGSPTIEITGRDLKVKFTKEQILNIPVSAEYYVYFETAPNYVFHGSIFPKYGSGSPTGGYNEVVIQEGEVKVVEVMGLDLVKTQVDLAKYYSLQASQLYFDQGPYNAATNTPTLTADATIGQQGEKMSRYKVTVGGVLNFAGENFTAGTSVANYDELIQFYNGKWYLVPGPFTPSDDITVQNYADAVPYFTGDAKRRVYVTTDFAYNEGNESFYDWIPGRGEYFLGLDPDYKDV